MQQESVGVLHPIWSEGQNKPFSEYRTWPGIVLRTSTILTILLINSICGEPKKPWGVFLATSTICNVLSSTFPHSKLNKGEPPPPCRMLNPSPEISIVHNYLVGLYTKQNYEHCAALVILSQNKYATFPQLLLKVLFRLIFLQQEHVFMFAFELYLLEKGLICCVIDLFGRNNRSSLALYKWWKTHMASK